MKVLFLTNIPSPYRVDFFNELGKYCDLTVLYELDYATDRNKNWKADNERNFKGVFLNGKRFGPDSALCFSVIKFLKDKSYDLIVIGGYSTPTGMLAIEYLRLMKRRFILNSDGGIIKRDSKRKFIIKKHFISSANAWLSTGKETDKYLIHYGANKEKIYRYPLTSIKENDILTEFVSRDYKKQIKEKLCIKEERIIISVGQFIYRKGYDVLIKAMKELPKFYGVYIIGGEATEEYVKLKEKYKLNNLHFEGFKDKNELINYYKASDIFVLPTREDIWGLVINEAMSIGLPIITTYNCVAGLELIENYKNGFLFNSENSIELADKISLIINNDKLISDISINNIKKIHEYTIENMVQVHINIFKKVIEEEDEKNKD